MTDYPECHFGNLTIGASCLVKNPPLYLQAGVPYTKINKDDVNNVKDPKGNLYSIKKSESVWVIV